MNDVPGEAARSEGTGGRGGVPTVTVIMNCLNGAEHLREALDSVFAQTWTDWEIVFWDNASTDASPSIAASYGPRVRVFRARETTPLGAARNLALAQGRGEYIAFLDCDDIWLPTKLEKQAALLRADSEVGLVCTDTELFNGRKTLSRLFDTARPERGRVFRQLMTRQWISMSSAMIRRDALAGLDHWFDERLNVCEEADLFYRIAKDWKLDFVPEPLTRWRVHGVNTTFRKFGRFAEETRIILAKHRALYPGYDEAYADLVALLSRRAAFQEAVALWREGRGAEARRLLRPYADSAKVRLFLAASLLPGSAFDLLARLYFRLPGRLRR